MDAYVLISHPMDEGVLVTKEGTLPIYESKHDYTFASDGYLACKELCSQLNLPFDLNFLRQEAEFLYTFYHTTALSVLEVLCDSCPKAPEASATYRWVKRDEADTIEVHPFQEAVANYLTLYKQDGLKARCERLPPYSKPGWFSEASEWIMKELSEFRQSTKIKVVRVKSSSNGCVLCATATGGTKYYMKAVGRGVYNEACVTSVLSEVMPRYFPKLVAVHEARQWLLMEDYGATLTIKKCSLKRNKEFARKVLLEWATIQKESVFVVDELRRRGVPKIGGEELLKMLEEVISDPVWWDAQRTGLIKDKQPVCEEGVYKSKFMSFARNVVDDVSKLGLPMTLVHGDPNPVNVAPRKNGFTFFDFEAAMISYPFLDALSYVFVCNEYEISCDDVAFYFKVWGQYTSEDVLREAFDAMQMLQLLFDHTYGYTKWKYAEESNQKQKFEELCSPVTNWMERRTL